MTPHNPSLPSGNRRHLPLLLGALLLPSAPLAAQSAEPQATAATAADAGPTYADLVTLAEAADLVVKAEIRRQVEVERDRAPGLAQGHARLYIEGDTESLISGNAPVGGELRWLVDVPLTERGRVPRLRRESVILFARPVAGRPGELQLVDPGAQFLATPAFEEHIRPIIASTLDPGKPPVVTGIADVLSIPGNLAGESETQLFLRTVSGDPASISVIRRPGQPPRWGVSWTELVDQSAVPPALETLAWHRLACGLPPELPADANLARGPAGRAQAAEDYALVLRELGPCGRSLD